VLSLPRPLLSFHVYMSFCKSVGLTTWLDVLGGLWVFWGCTVVWGRLILTLCGVAPMQ